MNKSTIACVWFCSLVSGFGLGVAAGPDAATEPTTTVELPEMIVTADEPSPVVILPEVTVVGDPSVVAFDEDTIIVASR